MIEKKETTDGGQTDGFVAFFLKYMVYYRNK